MAIDEVLGQEWRRKHDDPSRPVVPSAPRTVYPKSLAELIEICSTRKPSERIRAAGSHFALSTAAVSDNIFVETHDPNNLHQAMGRTLYDVVPGCLSREFLAAIAARRVLPFDQVTVTENEGLYPVHIETGKRIYQLYSELDAGDDDSRSLAVFLEKNMGNPDYRGSWGFPTLGSAGGQTVFGALATGTHGGDFRMAPIADAVLALHLVADGGNHYWIEPKSLTPLGARLTDDSLLIALYGGTGTFEPIRDDDVFNAVLLSAGRFGIVYSIVIGAVRQYCLHQERRLTTWQGIKSQIADPESALYTHTDTAGARNRFVQIVINVTPQNNFTENLAAVTKRWNVALVADAETGEPAGRAERRGRIVNSLDALIQAPRFEFAGNNFAYQVAIAGGFLETACSNADFMIGVIDGVMKEIGDFIASNGLLIGVALLAVTAMGEAGTLLALLPALAAILVLLATFMAALAVMGDRRLGQVMNDLRALVMKRGDPLERAAGILVWHMIASDAFRGQQKDDDFEAISYAVMDFWDYRDKSCNANIDSIEVFFDATDPMAVAYIDALLKYEIKQEVKYGRAFVGAIAVRLTGPTRALIGQQRFPLSCAVEVAGLRDASGVTELMEYAIALALDSNVKGILHWGQRNESRRGHVEARFGDRIADRTGDLHTWRDVLSRFTQNGRLDGFSSAFTRQTGLEIVAPILGTFDASSLPRSRSINIRWNCDRNPPGTELSLEIISPSGAISPFAGLPLAGQHQVRDAERGMYRVSIVVAIPLDGERREVGRQVRVTIV